ncbi:MAG TPA: DnaB-like helicase C-terminal domain-containing protein, partial [Thermoanaerobaculia bacterium]|nr:DnaB-like helicase C-terminal domain-containing protein [Thermoanaerobaculia bacterium]
MDRFNAERIRKTVGLEDFAQVLEALGATVDRAARHSTCPVHKGTGRDAVHFEERDGLVHYRCVTGCGGQGGDVLTLVQRSLGVTLPLAATWLKDSCGIPKERRRKDRRAGGSPVSGEMPTLSEPPPAGAAASPLPRTPALEWERGLAEWRSGFERRPIPTGLRGIDELLGGGLRERRVYVLAGAPGSGRTSLALRLAHAAATAGCPVLYVSYECEDVEIRARLVAGVVKTPYGQMLAPEGLLQVEREQVSSAWKRYAEGGPGARMLITVPGGRDIGEPGQPVGSMAWLRAEAERRARDFGRPPLVVVDDLKAAVAFSDEVDPFSSGPDFAAARTSLALRLVARGAGSAVLVVASLAPNSILGPHDPWRLPELPDMESSGGLGGNADAVLTLWPDGEDWETYEGKGLARDASSRRPVVVRAVKGRQNGPGLA